MTEERTQERRLAAILAADVVGYSRLMEDDEAGTLAALRTSMNGLIAPAIAAHRGRIVKTLGDGCIAEFASVVDAVRCAVAVQRGLAARGVELRDGARLEFRIGINLGDVVVEDGDLYGDGVNVAARLQHLAEPGGVVISGTAYDQLQGKLDVTVMFAGDQHLKNIARPVRTYRVALDNAKHDRAVRVPWSRGRVVAAVAAVILISGMAAAFLVLREPSPGLMERASLAVLPFVNIAGDEESGRLADGLTEDIITDLSRYRTMDVIARNSTASYKGKAVDPREVGRNLDVRYVLEGSVQRDGEQIRITAQLIDARDNAHIWSERWDRPAKEFFAVQTEIADQLGSRVGGVAIDKAEQEAARRSRPGNLTAYEIYLAGRSEVLRFDAQGNKRAIELYEQAVAADPALARAWVELSGAHQASINYGAEPAVALPAALAAARRAVELDPGDATAHALLGRVLGMQGDLGPSEAEFDTALRLNPGDAEILTAYASWAVSFGHPERAAEFSDRAIRLNPSYRIWQAFDFSYAYFSVDRYADTLRILEGVPKDSYIFYSWVLRAASYAALGRSTEAKAAVVDALGHYPDLTIEGFTGTPDWSAAERKRLVDTMRLTGFPACAKPERLAQNPNLVRLSECLAE